MHFVKQASWLNGKSAPYLEVELSDNVECLFLGTTDEVKSF